MIDPDFKRGVSLPNSYKLSCQSGVACYEWERESGPSGWESLCVIPEFDLDVHLRLIRAIPLGLLRIMPLRALVRVARHMKDRILIKVVKPASLIVSDPSTAVESAGGSISLKGISHWGWTGWSGGNHNFESCEGETTVSVPREAAITELLEGYSDDGFGEEYGSHRNYRSCVVCSSMTVGLEQHPKSTTVYGYPALTIYDRKTWGKFNDSVRYCYLWTWDIDGIFIRRTFVGENFGNQLIQGLIMNPSET